MMVLQILVINQQQFWF